jgi:4-hydroxy-2-oxoheptanedioate aldolase
MPTLSPNPFKRLLQQKPTVYGLWLGLPDTSCAEICALAGFDWLLVDAEHAPFDVPAVLRHLQVLAAYDVPVLVRPVDGSASLLKQLLDVGARTLLVPMVESAAQATQIAAAVRYPPQGLRGLGTSLARAAQWNRNRNYLHEANAGICLIAQVETQRAIDNLTAILAVDGIDAVFVGPSDLAASMGHLGEPGHPAVVAAVEDVLRRVRAAGKSAGVLAVDPTLAARYVAAGANFIGVGVDTALLATAASALATRYRETGQPGAQEPPAAGY